MSTGPVAALDRIRDAGLLKTQGLVGGKWIDAYDGKKIEVI
jgi:succinate-semialdehyde dehydrogenase, mitochondrial